MNDRDPFEDLDSPPPPPGLREAALRAGRAAMATAPVTDRWTELFANRGLRTAWLTAVLVLLAANALVPPGRAEDRGPLHRLDPEIAQVARPAHLDGPALPTLGGAGLEGDRL